VGGTENHAHLLIGIPADMAVAKAVQLIKAGSSKWLREQKGLAARGESLDSCEKNADMIHSGSS